MSRLRHGVGGYAALGTPAILETSSPDIRFPVLPCPVPERAVLCPAILSHSVLRHGGPKRQSEDRATLRIGDRPQPAAMRLDDRS